MIRMFNVYFPRRTLLLAATEALLIFFALLAAAFVRYGDDVSLILNYGDGFFRIALASGVCMLCMYYYDLYDSFVFTNPREVLTRLVQVVGTAWIVLAVLYYTFPPAGLGVAIFLIGTVLVGVFLAGWRRVFFVLNRSTYLAEKAVILGEGPLAAAVAAEIERHPELGIHLIGQVGHAPNPNGAVNGLECLGSIDQLSTLVRSKQVTRVIVTMGDRRGNLPVEELLQLKTCGVLIQDGADVYEAVAGKIPLDSLRLSWLLFSSGFRVSRATLIYKRLASVVFSSIGLVLTLPVMALISAAIWCDSRRPIIFRQKRIGKNGRPFKLYKFRSMKNDAGAEGKPLPAQKNDGRFTRVGRWIRRVRLDELPQLYNILRGDMYLVGPRPFVLEQEAECLREIPFYSQRWSVKPGATGWAQIHRGYCATLEDNSEKLAYDLFYIKNLSMGLDLFVVLKTIKILLLGRGGR